MFEVGLGADEQRCDFMTCLANVREDAERARGHVGHPQLQVGRSLLEPWCANAALRAALPLLWFEWDMKPSGPETALASVCLDASFLSDAAAPTRSQQVDCVRQVLGWTVEPAALGASISREVERCLRELPEHTSLLHLASLQGRGVNAVRVTLGLKPFELVSWLKAIGWTGNLGLLAVWCRIATLPWQRVFVQVEVGERLHSYLGVETRLVHDPMADPIESGLVEYAFADRARVTALRNWAGHERLRTAPELSIERSFYVKVAPFDERPLCAKAYLGFNLVDA